MSRQRQPVSCCCFCKLGTHCQFPRLRSSGSGAAEPRNACGHFRTRSHPSKKKQLVEVVPPGPLAIPLLTDQEGPILSLSASSGDLVRAGFNLVVTGECSKGRVVGPPCIETGGACTHSLRPEICCVRTELPRTNHLTAPVVRLCDHSIITILLLVG